MTSGAASENERRGPGRPAGAKSGEARDALLEAARGLMAEKGMPRVTVREVAERAGVQPALVNYYFGGKDGLVREVTVSMSREMLLRVQAAVTLEGSIEERFRVLLRGIAAALASDRYAPRLIFEQILFAEDDVIDDFVAQYARPNLALLSRLLEDGRASGDLREIDPMSFIPTMMGSVIFFFLASPIVQRLFDIREITPEIAEAHADRVASLLLRGLLTDRNDEVTR